MSAYVFTRKEYAPSWMPRRPRHVIRPSIDPLAPKNVDMSPDQAAAILSYVGIIDGRSTTPVPFARADGTPRARRAVCGHLANRAAPEPGRAPGRSGEPVGSAEGHGRSDGGFVEHVLDGSDAHLVLAGPVVTAVADDPEAAEVLDATWNGWRGLHHHQRSRVQLVCLPMSDLDENAIIVNALQRHASIVAQKSWLRGLA